MTKIEWTDETWNPVTGCTKVSAGCKHCYAERISKRFKRPFDVTLHLDRLDKPLHWRKPRRVFVCSMGDLFHEDVPGDFIREVFHRIWHGGEHTYQILTKRPKRMQEAIKDLRYMWPERVHDDPRLGEYFPWRRVWLGVSCEDQAAADARIPLLLQTPAAVRFVSCEPLLEPVDLAPWLTTKLPDGSDIFSVREGRRQVLNWVIAGCESSPKARPADPDWFRSLRDQCQAAGVPFFLKQMMIDGKKVSMPKLDGKVWAEYPKCNT